jgi:hypothetical protein
MSFVNPRAHYRSYDIDVNAIICSAVENYPFRHFLRPLTANPCEAQLTCVLSAELPGISSSGRLPNQVDSTFDRVSPE